MSKARELSQRAGVDGALSNRNKVINGSFDVWQRGTPIANSAGGSYFGADRWKGYSGSTRTFTQDTTSALSIGFPNCVKAETGTAAASFYNRIEDVRTLAGQTVTLSYYIKADADHTPAAAYLAQSFGSGGSATVFTYLSSPSVTTSWQRVVQTVTLPSVEGKTIGASSYLEVYPITLSASQTYYITGVQLEVGDTATPFEHRSFGQELALCQRYFCRIGGNGRAFFTGGSNASQGYISIPFPTTMRTSPTFSNGGGFTVNNFSAGGTPSSIAIDLSSPTFAELIISGGVSYTLGNSFIMYETSTDSGNLKFDAEL